MPRTPPCRARPLRRAPYFRKRALLLATMGILQATFLLGGKGLLIDNFASKMGNLGS